MSRFKPGRRTMRSEGQPELDVDSLEAQQREADIDRLAQALVTLQRATAMPWYTRIWLGFKEWLKRKR